MARHRVKKNRLKGGPSKTLSLTRQLTKNFIEKGKITTTEKRARVLKSEIEVLVYKAIKNKESDKNFLLKKIADKKVIARLVVQIAPLFKDRVGGYVRVIKLTSRARDGAQVAKLEWSQPVVIEEKKRVVEKKEAVKKPVAKTVQKKAIKK